MANNTYDQIMTDRGGDARVRIGNISSHYEMIKI